MAFSMSIPSTQTGGRGSAFPAIFFGAIFVCIALVNQGLLRTYERYEGRFFGRAWAEKKRAFDVFRAGPGAFNGVYIGDSTVEGGAAMELIDAGGFNLGRSGFEPSRLPDVARLLIDGGARKPTYALLTLTLSHISEDAWSRPGNVPLSTALADEARLFYADSNSFKSLLCGGCAYLHTLAEKLTARFDVLIPRPQNNGAESPVPLALTPIYRREANFLLIEDFKRRLNEAGIRLIWVYLPVRRDYRENISVSPLTRDFAVYAERRLGAIFGPDLIDMRGMLDDEHFLDVVHADADGAKIQSAALGRLLAARAITHGR